jgi:putative DNA-invertase from lambdoid prophage Rac
MSVGSSIPVERACPGVVPIRGDAKTKAAQRADIEHAKQSGERVYLGRKPSFTREQFVKARALLGHVTVGIAQIARQTGLTRQTVYRISGC